jgi:rubredoxin
MPFRKFTCEICGHVYDEAEGDPHAGIALMAA